MAAALVYDDGTTEVALFTLDAEAVDYWNGVCSFHDDLRVEEREETLPANSHDGEYELVYVTEEDGDDVVQNLRMVADDERDRWESRVADCRKLRVQEFVAIDYGSM